MRPPIEQPGLDGVVLEHPQVMERSTCAKSEGCVPVHEMHRGVGLAQRRPGVVAVGRRKNTIADAAAASLDAGPELQTSACAARAGVTLDK